MDISTPQVFTLHQIVLHQLAKKMWDYLHLVPSNGCKTIREYIKLIAYKEKTLGTVWPLSGFPKLFKSLIAEAVWRLDQGYKEAWSWKRICKRDIPIIFSLACGQYDARNFINPDGHFDDLAWAKRFVTDETQNILDRYKFACLYCFEDVLENQWHTIRSNNVLLHEIKENTQPSGLVAIWTFSLKNETKILPRNIFRHTDFYVCGLRVAVLSGFEIAARFFWEHLSPDEKDEFLAQFHCADLALPASKDSSGIVSFIYLLLPVDKKLYLVTHDNCKDCESIWRCLFNSSSRELVINEIITFPFVFVSPYFYEKLLSGITSCLESHISNNQFHNIFRIIWRRITRQKKEEDVLPRIEPSVLPRLAKMRAFNLLKMIISPLPHDVKDKLLFGFRPNIYIFFFNIDDYEAQLDYLLLFVTDQNPITKMLVMRADASAVLDSCVKKDFIVCWSDSSFEKLGRRQYEELVECLQNSFEVLQQLMHQVDEMNCLTAAFEDSSTPNLIGTD